MDMLVIGSAAQNNRGLCIIFFIGINLIKLIEANPEQFKGKGTLIIII